MGGWMGGVMSKSLKLNKFLPSPDNSILLAD